MIILFPDGASFRMVTTRMFMDRLKALTKSVLAQQKYFHYIEYYSGGGCIIVTDTVHEIRFQVFNLPWINGFVASRKVYLATFIATFLMNLMILCRQSVQGEHQDERRCGSVNFYYPKNCISLLLLEKWPKKGSRSQSIFFFIWLHLFITFPSANFQVW